MQQILHPLLDCFAFVHSRVEHIFSTSSRVVWLQLSMVLDCMADWMIAILFLILLMRFFIFLSLIGGGGGPIVIVILGMTSYAI